MATQDQALTVEGWEFQLVNDQLSITSQSNPATQVQLSPQGAFALLGYLSQHRDDLYWASQQGARDESEHYLSERLTDGEATDHSHSLLSFIPIGKHPLIFFSFDCVILLYSI